MESETFS